jgi:formate--tetrahydrofolate ligase
MKTDLEIAQSTRLKPIGEVAAGLGINPDSIEPYGHHVAKVALKNHSSKKGKLILVTAISATKTGIGKTTVSIGLALGLNKIGRQAIVTLREPSLGPCFGLKGGAAGGGYAQVLPMEKINLHFTGDFHAVTAAHNLIAAMLDNYIFQQRKSGFSFKEIFWRRVMDVNDRALRNIVTGLGSSVDGIPAQSGFDITAASEIMAILCLAADEDDMRRRVGRIVLAIRHDDTPFTVNDLNATGAAMALLADAMKPNLVQTTENTPALIHGGPFANIAHGCNSVIATKLGMSLADFCITEAGFGADLGAEKYYDIVARDRDLIPDLTILVATVGGLKFHGDGDVSRGMANLNRHIRNIRAFGQRVIVVLNRFANDTDDEIKAVFDNCHALGVSAVINDAYANGGDGAIEMARLVEREISDTETKDSGTMNYAYDLTDSVKTKIEKLAQNIYGARDVNFSAKALKGIALAERIGLDKSPICVAKTPFSFSADAKALGASSDFTLDINDVIVNAGADMVVVIAGNIMRMPGLPARPQAENIDLINGEIVGLS